MATHLCKDIKELESAEAAKLSITKLENSWLLNYCSLATEYDVRVGEADELNEVIQSLSLKINYCPYCGEILK